MLIDETYFNGLMMIPNIAEPDPNNRSANDLSNLIEICEEEVLSFAFGAVMWADFKTKYETEPAYIDIMNGKTYEKDGKTFIWGGLVNSNLKRSLLVDYVFCQYHTNNVTQQTEFGQVAADTKVGQKASSTPKITKSWNNFLMKFQGGTYLNGATGLTPEGNPYWIIPRRLGNGYGVSYAGGNTQGGEVSLIQYLTDHKADLPLLNNDNSKFGLQFKNSFGI